MTNEEAHRLAREKGVSRPLYAFVKALVTPAFRIYFRMHVRGAGQVPAEGAVIIAPNHKSFWDSFFVGICVRRHVRFMAKTELVEKPYGPLLVRLGAFPVRRGESDADALETALTILRQGGVLALFPEGTRIRDPDELGDPKRGVGRIAIEAQAPIVPAAISGTEQLFAGPFPKPLRVQVAFADPVPVKGLPATKEAAAELVQRLVWPEVEQEFRRLRARRGAIAAGATALGLGVGGGLVAQRRRARRRRSRLPWRR
jgi:1-acyl-sn-glycerol-3-phosphate acyltransferase